MTLDEFIAVEHQRLAEFKAFWLAENATYPESYPMELDEGEWDEQLRLVV